MDTAWIDTNKVNDSQFWDVIWSRPYVNYEKHHQFFWNKIRKAAHGRILDIACGSASCWKGTNVDLYGIDFSMAAICEAIKNCPNGHFEVEQVPTDKYNCMVFDTVVLSGLVNYYPNLKPLVKMVQNITKPGSTVIITINVLEDFPGRVWTDDEINNQFCSLGRIWSRFYEKIGWIVEIIVD